MNKVGDENNLGLNKHIVFLISYCIVYLHFKFMKLFLRKKIMVFHVTFIYSDLVLYHPLIY
jgi:hypothetical protein